jgi:2,4-dienoyl-CoA reductase (NADPH2)
MARAMTPEASQIRDRLIAPLRIGSLSLRNRIFMGPMAALQPQADGRPSAQTIAFLAARARGGVGMIIVGGAIGTRRGNEEAPFKPLLRFDVEEYLPDLARLADAIHAYGVPVIAEIMTSFGRMGTPAPGRDIISASPINVYTPEDRFPRGLIVPGGRTTAMPRAATIEEIRAYERETIEAALRAHRAGWDGVEIPAHMSYFAASFLSPRTNWRTDEYGGSRENRARFLVNVVSGIRAAAGPDLVIGLRVLAAEHVGDGQGPDEYAAIAKLVEQAGADYVAVTDGCYESMDIGTSLHDGTMVEHGEVQAFKAALSVPIIVQGFHDPANAAAAIASGHGDAIMLARPLLADPDYAAKIEAGRPETIIKCDRHHLCLRRLVFNMPVYCSVNPTTGREARQGRPPPPRRLFTAPVEWLILALTGSQTLMGFVRWLIQRKNKAKPRRT